MWYFLWIVGTLFACAVGAFFALRLERYEEAHGITEEKSDA